MRNMTTQTVLLLACGVLVLATIVRGDVNCKQRQSLKTLEGCCEIPEPKIEAYSEQCFKNQTPESLHFNKKMSCIFNVTNSLQGDMLNMDQLRVMLSTIFPEDKDFRDAFALGFEKCMPEITELASKKRRSPSSSTLNCTPFARTLVFCAQLNVYLTCPPKAWTLSDACQQTKEYFMQC